MPLRRMQARLARPFWNIASRPSRTKPEEGMTIIEILIVIALIGTIMTIVIGNFMRSAENAKIDLTRAAQQQLSTQLMLYRTQNNHYPSSSEGLNALLNKPESARNWQGPYGDPDKIRDAWGNDMQYELIDAKTFRITSAGADSEFGNEDDIAYPPPRDASPTSTEFKVPKGQKNP